MSATTRTPSSSRNPQPDDLLLLSVAAQRLGVQYETFRRWVAKGVLPHVRIRNRKRVYRRDVEALIQPGTPE